MWVNDNKMDLKKIRLESRDWPHLGQERDQQQILVNTVMKPLTSIKAAKFLEQIKSIWLHNENSTQMSGIIT
jgi:hypothetical protein